jgi:Flp pilus assembly protein TadD
VILTSSRLCGWCCIYAAPAQDKPRRRLISNTVNLTKMKKIVVPALRPQRIMAAVLAAAALTIVSGCAARKSSPGRFVKPGEPATSFDVQPVKPKADGLGEYTRRLRTLQANARTNITLGATLESQNASVASAILRLGMDPSAQSHHLLADAYRQAGVTDYAYRHWRLALQLDACDSRALEGLARLWRDWGSPGLALGDAHRAVYCKPRSSTAHNTLGTILEALGQRQHARREFEFALQLDSQAGFALNNLCYLALQDGDGRSAQETCTRALAIDPTMAAAQTNLALAYALQGEIPKAEARLLDHADTATGLYNVGVLRMSMNQYSEAATAFDLAASTRPSLADAARRAVQARKKNAAIKEQ